MYFYLYLHTVLFFINLHQICYIILSILTLLSTRFLCLSSLFWFGPIQVFQWLPFSSLIPVNLYPLQFIFIQPLGLVLILLIPLLKIHPMVPIAPRIEFIIFSMQSIVLSSSFVSQMIACYYSIGLICFCSW